MESNIFAQIRKENWEFMYNYISPVPGYGFNQYQTIKRIYLYLHNKYEDGGLYMGREKLFFNVITPPCEVGAKMLNVDSKNIRILPINNPRNYFPTYLLEKELRVWLKTSKFGSILNQVAEEAPRYGSVVLEKVKGGAQVVDLRRLFLDPSVDNIKDSRFITTVHYMTESELRASGWDETAINQAIERFRDTNAAQSFEDKSGDVNLIRSSPYIKIYKRYGEVPENWLEGGNSDKNVRALYIVAGADSTTVDKENRYSGENGVILFKSKWRTQYPYRDYHYQKVKGRWLGMGIPEMLFDIQVRVNELKNQLRLSMEISSIHLFTSPDKSIVRNVLTDLESGDLLQSENGITPIATEERNLSAFGEEEASYMNQADKLTFSFEAIRGELPPASTPLGTVQIAVAQSTSVFGFKRQNLSLMYRDLFNDLVMPELIKDLTPEHIMRFTGSAQEIDKLDQIASEIYVNDVIKEHALNSITPTIDDQEIARARALAEYKKLGQSRFIKIKENFYKDVEFEFDFNIDNEQIDPSTIVQNISTLSPFLENPAILQDPRMKLLFNQLCEQLGVNPAELELASEQAAVLEQNGQLPSLSNNNQNTNDKNIPSGPIGGQFPGGGGTRGQVRGGQ